MLECRHCSVQTHNVQLSSMLSLFPALTDRIFSDSPAGSCLVFNKVSGWATRGATLQNCVANCGYLTSCYLFNNSILCHPLVCNYLFWNLDMDSTVYAIFCFGLVLKLDDSMFGSVSSTVGEQWLLRKCVSTHPASKLNTNACWIVAKPTTVGTFRHILDKTQCTEEST